MPEISVRWSKVPFTGSENLAKIKTLVDDTVIGTLKDDRTVYVIRSDVPFAFRYPKQPSPVSYIGSGACWSRLSSSHSRWMQKLHADLGLKFTVYVTAPRIKNAPDAYKTVEADLILSFVRAFGTYPLMNKREERAKRFYSYSDEFLKPVVDGQLDAYKAAIEVFEGELGLTVEEG